MSTSRVLSLVNSEEYNGRLAYLTGLCLCVKVSVLMVWNV